jgi:hypothetical protein
MHDFIGNNNLYKENMFFKIDIEGGEYSLIPVLNKTFTDHNAILFLSFHPANLFGSIIKENKNILKKVSAWIKVLNTHFEILSSLPFRFRYLQSGRKLNVLNLLYYTMRLRSFSIVAADQKWQ